MRLPKILISMLLVLSTPAFAEDCEQRDSMPEIRKCLIETTIAEMEQTYQSILLKLTTDEAREALKVSQEIFIEYRYKSCSTGDYVAQVTFFCRGDQNLLMLSASFISTTDDKTFITIKTVDEFGKVISSQRGDNFRVRSLKDGTYLDIELDEQMLASIKNAQKIEVDAGLFVHADQRVTLELDSMDRKSILTALKLCI